MPEFIFFNIFSFFDSRNFIFKTLSCTLLEAIKEEEIVAEVMGVKAEPVRRKRKKFRACRKAKASPKKRRLATSANRYVKNAREKTTIAWHKSCRFNTTLYARKFREILDGFDSWTVMKSAVPPVAALTNENMKLFLVKCWETGSKPNVQQGRKWLTHSLTKQGMPPLNKLHRQNYAETLDMLKGLAKELAWREHVPKSTDAFELDTTVASQVACARKSSTRAC